MVTLPLPGPPTWPNEVATTSADKPSRRIVVINGGFQPVREALGDHIAALTERILNR
jgi:hypothetical protein